MDTDSENKRLRFLLASSPTITYTCEAFGNFDATFITENLTEVLGYLPSEFLNTPNFWIDNIHPDDKEKIIKGLSNLFEKGSHVHEYRFKHKDGHYVWMRDRDKLINDSDGKPLEIIGSWSDITEHRQAEEALSKSESKFRALVETTQEWIWAIDLEGTHTYSNEVIFKILDITPEDFFARPAFDFLHPEDVSLAHKTVQEALKKKLGWTSLVLRWRHKNGSYHFLESNSSPILDAAGEVQGWYGADRDITERKKAEEELKEKTNFLDKIIETSALSMWISDEKGTAIRTNPACLEFFGATEEEVIGKYNLFQDVVIEKQGFMPVVKEVFEKGKAASIELDYDFGAVDHVDVKNANHKIIKSILTPVLDKDGRVSNVISQSIDFTDIRKTEKDLRQQTQGLSTLLKVSKNLAATLEVQDILQLSVDGMASLAGLSTAAIYLIEDDQLILRATTPPLPPNFPDELRIASLADHPHINKAVTLGEPIQVYDFPKAGITSAERLVAEQRNLRTVLFVPLIVDLKSIGVLIVGSNEEPSFFSDAEIDLSRTLANLAALTLKNAQLYRDGQNHANQLEQTLVDRKLAEKKIRESEEYIRNILNTVDDGFIVVDRDFRIMTANQAYCDLASLTSDKVIGAHCYKISHQTERPCFENGEDCTVKQAFSTGFPHMAVHKHQSGDGEILYVETKAFPQKDQSGNVVSAIKTTRNITERRLLEAEQLKTQKLEALGTLAGGIAHDFNNLLQGVFGYVSLAKMSSNQPDKVIESLGQAEKALSLSVNLTTQLLTFAKGGKPVKKKVDLRPVIENATKFALSGSKCDCQLHFEPNLWPTEGDEGQIAQVIQNIVLNASESMPEGGIVNLSSENITHSQEGRQIRITVKDEGIGIPESYRSKIFDPYFTTKQKGSGLGLATSYSIIKNHGGSLEVESLQNKGTTFIITLPACDPEILAENVLESTFETQKQNGRILLMDDDAMIRNVAQSMIETLGHKIELASYGEEAIGKYHGALASNNPFDLVILDLTIKGGMGGEETIRKLQEIDPNVRAVVSSGYSDDPVVSEYRDYGFQAMLNKPYTINELKECLTKMIG